MENNIRNQLAQAVTGRPQAVYSKYHSSRSDHLGQHLKALKMPKGCAMGEQTWAAAGSWNRALSSSTRDWGIFEFRHQVTVFRSTEHMNREVLPGLMDR